MNSPIPIRLTQYGYPTDETPDTLTEEGFGAWGNKLTGASCALKQSTAARYGIKPRAKLVVFLGAFGSGKYMTKFFDDHIPESSGPGEDRCDFFMPNGADWSLPDHASIFVIEDTGTTPALPL